MPNESYEAAADIASWRTTLWAPCLSGGMGAGLDLYVFGVFGGNSLIEWARIIESKNLNIKRVVGFDSFDGVPKETAEIVREVWDPEKSDFYKAFNASLYFDVSSPEEALECVRERVAPHYERIGVELVLVSGFFEDSLLDPPDMPYDVGTVAIIEVDVDIYSSTVTLLEWLDKWGLMVPGSTVIGYDDWDSASDYPDQGEGRATTEWTKRTGARLYKLMDNSDQRVFRYEGK